LTWNASDNYFGGQRLDIQRRRQAGAEVAVNHRQYIGRLTLDLGLRYHQGIRMLGALKAPEEAIGEGSAEARLLTWNFRLLAPFSVGEENFRFISSAWGQFALNKLISQDRFYLGGRYTVRGYTGDVNLAADSGYVFRNEVGWLIKETRAELYAGLDFGQVWGGPVADYLPGKALAGAVLGYRGAFKTFDYDLFVSVPVLKPRGFAAPKWVLGFNLGYEF
jgi:hemolysin activation/secretion protein